jgi:hypothetical protein
MTVAEDVVIFNLATAQAAAREERLAAWVDSYLRQSGPRANVPFADGLLLAQRWWSGPQYLPLDHLTRSCGPEPEMEFRVPRDAWEQYVTTLAQSFTTPEALPPLIVLYDNGTYRISDGNNRHEAMRRVGWTSCWIIVWYTSEDDYQRAGLTHA